MGTIALTTENFEQHVTAQGITFVDYWADWCGPCKMFAPVYEAAAEKNPDITFGKVDTEAQQEIAAGMQIQSIPTIMAFRDGVLLFAQPGAMSGANFDQVIQAVRDVDMDEVRRQIAEEEQS